MPQLAMSLLGQVQFALDGRPLIEFESDKARALLIYLAMDAGRPHRREQLSALFWPEQAERGALQNLRKTLHRLRQTLDSSPPTSFTLVTPQTVEFNVASEYELDVAVFNALIAETQHHRHRRRETCRTCIEHLTHAVQLYRGDFLVGFSLKDGPEFDDWVALHRERLRLQALDALNLLAAYHERRGEYATAQDYARRHLEIEPLQEMAHRQLMRALAYQGNRAAALAQYRICREALAKELGAEPEAETTALFEQIKVQKFQKSNSSKESDFLRLRNFPVQLTSFVGRERELAHIGQALQDPSCRLLTLIGTGGSGKTRLAIEAATAEASAFEDGACFVALAPLTSGELIPSAIANVLGMSLLPTQDAKTQVLNFLRGKEMLLVLDNFEHLLSGRPASLVSEMLQICPHVVVLVTSRESLHLYGEREFPVSPLPTPHLARSAGDAHASTLLQFPAVQLFVERAQAVNVDFHLNGNAAAVAEICDRLDGLPLAIELAAARSKLFKPHDILAQLQRRFAFLTTGAHDLPARQQTLWSAIVWSHDLLIPQEQTLFRRLAVFAGGFTLPAVEAICNTDGALQPTTITHLSALADKSLIYTTEASRATSAADSRFDMLETLHEYALNKLDEAGEAGRVRDEHLRFYCAFAEETERRMLRGDMSQNIARLEREHDNLRAALAWAYERGHFEMGLRLVAALSRFWRNCGYLSEGNDWSARMLAAGAEASPGVRAKALLGAAEMARIAGRNREAGSYTEFSLALYRALGDRGGAGYALTVLGAIAHYDKARDQATHLLAEAEDLFRTVGDQRGLGYALLWLGDVRLRMGDLTWAARCFSEALPIFRALDDLMYVSWALGGLGDIARFEGSYAEAEAALKEALELHVQVKNKYGMPFPIEALAIVAIAQGQAERAAILWGIAEQLRQVMDMPVPASYQADYDPHVAEARTRLGELAFDDMKAEGRALPFEQAIELVLKSA